MKLIGKLLAYPILAVNILTALLLIFSCYGSLAAPIGRWPFASLSGLAFPYLFLINLLFLFFWLMTWKKGAIVPAVTFLICLMPTLSYYPLHFFKSRHVTEPYITVVTYNTENFGLKTNKEWTLENPVLINYLEYDADIILLQEATQDIMNKISRNGPITARYPYVSVPKGINDVAYMSRFPVIGSESISFENSGNGYLYMTVLVDSDTLAVYNCHLQSNKLNAAELSEYQKFIEHPTDSTHYKASKQVLKKLLQSTSQRAEQARMIADKARNEKARYLIVCGDFNDTPLSYSHRVFGQFMQDAFAKSGAGAGVTYHEHKLHYRIDHIFCSNNITPLYTWVDRANKESDHYPVISKLQLQK